MKKKVIIFGCDENIDYLQFWVLQKKIWTKKNWLPKLYFIGNKQKYDCLKNDKNVYEIKPIKNIHTAYMAQMYCQFGVIFEDNDTIVYSCGMDNILVNNFEFIEDNFLNNIEYNKLYNICLDFPEKQISRKKNNVNTKEFWGMHNLAYGETFKKIYNNINPINFTDFLISNYPNNYTIRGHGWGTDQMLLTNFIKNWLKVYPNNIVFFSMADFNEIWFYRISSFIKKNYIMKNSYTGDLINNNYIDYIKRNNNITWLHPFHGELGLSKNECNTKVQNEIINPLLDYL